MSTALHPSSGQVANKTGTILVPGTVDIITTWNSKQNFDQLTLELNAAARHYKDL